MKAEIKPATAADVSNWYGGIPGTMKAVLLLVDGTPVAIGGMMRKDGFNMAFMDMKPEAQSVPFSVWKGSIKAMTDIISKSQTPVYAKVSNELATAPDFLRRLGFIPVDNNEEVMVCPVHGTQ